MTAEKIEILRKHWNLYNIAEIFLENYPEDIFINNPKPIVKIREGFKEILQIKEKKEND